MAFKMSDASRTTLEHKTPESNKSVLQNVEHHVAEEEAAMFPLAEEELEEDMQDLRDEMQELKKNLMAS